MLRAWWRDSAERGVETLFKSKGCFLAYRGRRIEHIAGSAELQDDDLEKLAVCSALDYLDLQRSPITDAGMPYVGRSKSLTRLHLGYTSVTANGLRHLVPLAKLSSLDLTGTSIQIEDAVEHLQQLRSLRWLDLRMTPKSDASTAAIEELRRQLPRLRFHPLGLAFPARPT